MTDHVATLADLVRRPSVNPMGREVAGPEYLEGRVTDHLVQRFSAAGLAWARQPVAPGRDNVIARLEATVPDAPVILWDAHQDTVPADGMTIDPFAPLVRDGRLYGRGACDVKGGMAAMLAALSRLQAAGTVRTKTVIFSATVNEEFGFSGAKALVRLWTQPVAEHLPTDTAARELVGGRPAAGIVAEPTELDIVTQHKGAVRWRIKIHGRACHSAFPERGDNAIYPGESPHDAREELIRRIATAVPGARIEHELPFVESAGLPEAIGGGCAEAIELAGRAIGIECRRTAARYGTNASIFAAAGVPSVVFGPGSIAQAHTADEWIDLDEVDEAARILCGLVTT